MFGFVVGLRGKIDESGGEKKEARRLFPKIPPRQRPGEIQGACNHPGSNIW